MTAIFALLFTSCSTEETSVDVTGDNTSAVLEFGAVLNNLANRAASDSKQHFAAIPDCSPAAPAMAEITFSVDEGTSQTIEVEILSDEDGYFTAYTEALKIAIPSGGSVEVNLEGFLVYDAGDNLIWVAPSDAGNPGLFDGYVNNALPFSTTVYAGTKPYIDVEVLCFDRRMVNEYGYPFFDIVPGTIYPLCFFANYCTDNGRHFVGNYSVALTYLDGDIVLYDGSEAGARPVTGVRANGEYYADPVCLVVPESPFEDMDTPYLSYTITPLDWDATYGNIDNISMTIVFLTGNDVLDLLNADGETNEYIHVFINCDDNPGGGDCEPTDDDMNGDCIPDVDQCDLYPALCNPGGGDCEPTDDDTNGDCVPDVEQCDIFPSLCQPAGNKNCETAFAYGNNDELEFRDIYTGNGNGRWGWIAQGEGTYTIYAAAGNQYKKDMPVGTATVTIVGVNVKVDIEDADGYDFTELHIDLFSGIPTYNDVKAPGQYSYNESNPSQGSFVYTNPTGDNSFYIVIHAVSCDE
ncbi:hypothetical protein DHD80_14160 [Gramella sp. AN32]|nr:hypothetical protein [Gramella sp. AN32]